MHTVRFRSFPLVSMLLLAAVPIAHADGAADDDVLGEVVVTGTLRGERLRDVPGSVTVLGENVLHEAGQQHFGDVLGLVPNLNWAGGTSRPRFFQIRGFGDREQQEGMPNPAVGFLIDDIDFSGLGMPATLFDLQQIEVLRGPQGTRHGANALAGLVVIRGNEPEREAGYSFEASGGDYGTGALGFTATGPLSAFDSAWRVSVQKYRSDGFMRNSFLGRDDTNDRDELTARVKWHGELAADTALDFTYLHADLDNGYDAWAIDNSRTTLSDKPGRDSQRSNGFSLKLGTGAGANRLTFIGSLADSRTVNSYDSDWGDDASWAPYIYDYTFHQARRHRTGSLELRLTSPADEQFEWLAGVHALRMTDSGRDTSFGRYADPGDPDDGGSTEQFNQHSRATNLALFGQLNGLFAPQWHWSAGLRLEQRRTRYDDDNPQLPIHPRDSMLGGQLAISRDFTAGASAYVALSRGYRAGGANVGDLPDARRGYDAEYLWNIETGMKASLGSRGYADVALFYQRRRDQQARTGIQAEEGDPNTYRFITVNLPKGYGAGVEASLQYELVHGLSLGASLGLLHTRSGAFTMQDENGDPVAVRSRQNAHAPPYTAALNATWRGGNGFMARVDLTAMDSFYFDVPTDHDQKSRAYQLVNLKAGYERGNWSVYGWVRNVFDKDYAVRGFYFENEPPDWQTKLYTQLGDPRQAGLTATLRF